MKQFHESLAKLLALRLSSFQHEALSKDTCLKIYSVIFETLSELIKKAGLPLDNEAVNYVAQQYYDAVEIKNNHDSVLELNPNIFTKRSDVKNISTKELALLAMLLDGTDFKYEVLFEIKQRS